MTAKCENCFFYRYSRMDEYAGRIGTCHYNPPATGKSTWDDFPQVRAGSWCGKWKEYSE